MASQSWDNFRKFVDYPLPCGTVSGMTPEQKLAAFIQQNPSCRKMTLEYAQFWLKKNAIKGKPCPACQTMYRESKKRIRRVDVLVMARLRKCFPEYAHYKTVAPGLRHTPGQLKHFGLVECKSSIANSGSTERGWWRLTQRGIDFLDGKVLMCERAVVLADQCLRYEGEYRSVHEIFGEQFSYPASLEKS